MLQQNDRYSFNPNNMAELKRDINVLLNKSNKQPFGFNANSLIEMRDALNTIQVIDRNQPFGFNANSFMDLRLYVDTLISSDSALQWDEAYAETTRIYRLDGPVTLNPFKPTSASYSRIFINAGDSFPIKHLFGKTFITYYEWFREATSTVSAVTNLQVILENVKTNAFIGFTPYSSIASTYRAVRSVIVSKFVLPNTLWASAGYELTTSKSYTAAENTQNYNPPSLNIDALLDDGFDSEVRFVLSVMEYRGESVEPSITINNIEVQMYDTI